MSPKLQYLRLTLKHKWFLFVAGRKLKVSLWRRITHDWTKLLPKNLKAYGRQFFGDADQPVEFVESWLRHQNSHDHHWEYWIPRTGHNRCTPPIPSMVPLDMSDQAIREMVADWLAAGRAYNNAWPDMNNWTWFNKNYETNILDFVSLETHLKITELIESLKD